MIAKKSQTILDDSDSNENGSKTKNTHVQNKYIRTGVFIMIGIRFSKKMKEAVHS